MPHRSVFKIKASNASKSRSKKGAVRPPVQDGGNATEEMPKDRVNMKEKYESLAEAIKETAPQSAYPYPLIQRVSYMLRNHKNFEKYFEPRAMAIGPLHHPLPYCRKSHLLLAEQHKLRLAGLFVKESGLHDDVLCSTNILFSKIWTEIQDLRKFFDKKEIISFTDEQLGWMLFVDGCAVLQLIKCVINGEPEELKIKTNELTIIIWDLFLLENQIPFRVLELLTSSDSNQKKQWNWRDVIQKLDKLNTEIESTKKPKKEEHIVNINETESRKEEVVELNTGIKSTKEEDIVNPVHLLDLFRTYLVPNTSPKSNTNENPKNSPSPKNKREEKDGDWHIFRNVKDLKSAGISLHHTGTSLLTDISFTSGCFSGKLTLPVITVDDSTGPKFMNLIAYEMCPDYDNDFTVTSYICFMDSLIDQAEDVWELRTSRILLNYLGSDEEVAQLFNEISTDLVPNPSAYNSVREEIEKHCANKCKTWRAEFIHDHFRSPWSILAFLSVLVVLLFTFIQTYFAAFPSNW